MKNIITANSVSIVAAVSVCLLLLSFAVVQTMTVVNVDAAKTSREKACTNPRNTEEKRPKVLRITPNNNSNTNSYQTGYRWYCTTI